MYKTVGEARLLLTEPIPGMSAVQNVEMVVCPPFPALLAVAALLEGTGIGLGAPNMQWDT